MPASPLSGRKAVDAAQSLRVHDHRDRYAVFDYLRCDIIHGAVCANRNDLKRSVWRAMTDRVARPMEPVDPRMATLVKVRDGSGGGGHR